MNQPNGPSGGYPSDHSPQFAPNSSKNGQLKKAIASKVGGHTFNFNFNSSAPEEAQGQGGPSDLQMPPGYPGSTPPMPSGLDVQSAPSLQMDPGMTGGQGAANPQTMPLGSGMIQPAMLNTGDRNMEGNLNVTGDQLQGPGSFSNLSNTVQPNAGQPDAMAPVTSPEQKNTWAQKVARAFVPQASAMGDEDMARYNRMIQLKSAEGKPLAGGTVAPGANDMNKYNPVYGALKGLDTVSNGLANFFNSGGIKKIVSAPGKVLSKIGDPIVRKATNVLKGKPSNKATLSTVKKSPQMAPSNNQALKKIVSKKGEKK